MNLQDLMWWLDRNAALIVTALLAVAGFAAVFFGRKGLAKKTRFFLFLPMGIAGIGGFLFCSSLNTELTLLNTIGTILLLAGCAVIVIYALVWSIPKAIRVLMTPKTV